jgi:hypothetical protein
MNVREFVSESLRQISQGVLEARQEEGIQINPQPLTGRDNTAAGHMVTTTVNYPIMLVDFDLSVAVQAKIEGDASAGLTVLGFGAAQLFFCKMF